MSTTAAIQTYDGGSYLTQWREPEEVLAEATKAAVALKKVVSMKKNPVIFNGEQYLEREDWGTVSKFYGCTAKTVETRYVEFGTVRGWEAVAVVIDRNMNEIGRAESMCLSDEENWGDVPKYEWQDELDENGKKIWVEGRDGKKRPKGKRVQIGTVPKPLFQLRSMAQTRAEAKALKGVFSWVVVLAGYRPTPAEEMTGNEERYEDLQEKKAPVQQPQRASEKQAEQMKGNSSKTQNAEEVPGVKSRSGPPQQQASEKEVSGIIEGVKQTPNVTWLTLKGHNLLVAVQNKDVDSDMAVGAFIKFRGGLRNHKQVGDYWILVSLIELSRAPEAKQETAAQAKPEEKMSADMAQVADELFGEGTSTPTVQGMIDSGQVKPASQVEAPKTIGLKRAQRLYALITQNKANNNGFSEAEMKKILQALPKPLEHLRDLEMALYDEFEKLCTGESDWREFWDK